jgi:hypothetical protein
MFTVGGYYITVKGRLAKIISDFKFKDNGNLQVAVHYPNNGWYHTRILADGRSVDNAEHNLKEEDNFKGFLTFCNTTITFDRTARNWKGLLVGMDGNKILELTGIESQERALKLLQLGAQEKVLTWMQETGYVDNELEEGAE